jgi:hypothetical protein
MGGVDGHYLNAHALAVLLEAAAKLSALVNPHSVGDAKKAHHATVEPAHGRCTGFVIQRVGQHKFAEWTNCNNADVLPSGAWR